MVDARPAVLHPRESRPSRGYRRAWLATLVASSLAAHAAELDAPTAARGLREALQQGATRAVEQLGRVDGYLGDPDVRIPVPDELKRARKVLRKIGLGSVVDDFETSLNRAAEAAVPLAREVVRDSIREMSFEDAVRIVRGRDHEATDYLREHAGPVLAQRFRPIVAEQLGAVGATRHFDRMVDEIRALPFVDRPVFELDAYVTDRALHGLFLLVEREERRIREDPLARTSDLLKQVFGGALDRGEGGPWWKRIFRRR